MNPRTDDEQFNGRIKATLQNLSKRLDRSRVKLSTIVAKCAELDTNKDDRIHISDLEEVLIHYLGIDGVSTREIACLEIALAKKGSKQKGVIEYKKLIDLLPRIGVNSNPTTGPVPNENWFEPAEIVEQRNWNRRGSVGDWLDKNACPAESVNFRRLISCLEDFERKSGMRCLPTENGFIVPLGPDLRASVNFFSNDGALP